MPGSFMDPTYANGCIETQLLAPLLDESPLHRSKWTYQRRSMTATLDRIGWVHAWPRSQFLSGSETAPVSLMGDCADSGGQWFEPPSIGNGTQTTKFLRGTIYDASGNPTVNAVVSGYVTTGDIWVGEVSSRDDGTYALGTNNPATTAHYIVAYKAGSPDVAGTTVNTLLPTNIDGT